MVIGLRPVRLLAGAGVFLGREMELDKRTSTVSSRIPLNIEVALQQMAIRDRTSLSELICQVLVDKVAEEQRSYLLLKQAFDVLPDLQGKSV